jgi:ribonuclease HI
MNLALRIFERWCDVHGFKINPLKSCYTVFTFKHEDPTLELFIKQEKIQKDYEMTYLGVTFDKKMTGKAHFENQAEKGRKRIRLMQRAAGVSWGAKMETLALTYISYVRPILEYGTEVFITASKNDLNILDKVQNIALRIISGAVKTAPIAAMQCWTKIDPLQFRTHQRAIQLHEKLARLDPKWLNFPVATAKAHTTFTQQVTALKEEYYPGVNNLPRQPLSTPSINTIPDAKSSIAPRLTIDGLDQKSSKTPKEVQKLAEDHMKKHYPLTEWVHIFTDGAHNPANGTTGFGVHCQLLQDEHHPLPLGSSHFDAEFAALARAAEMVAEAPNLPLGRRKAVIFSDSIAAIQSATSQINLRPQSIAFKKALVKSRSQNKTLEIQWIPSHSKIWGNEKADALAKMGTKERPPPLPPEGISLNSTVQKIKTKIKEATAQSLAQEMSNHHWEEEIRKGPDKNWSRSVATAQFRLRTGHDVLQHHLSRFNITDDPATCRLCTNGVQDRAHLFECATLLEDNDALIQQMTHEEAEAYLYWTARRENNLKN